MDFFERQQRLRRQTAWIVAAFVAAIVAIVLIVQFALWLTLGFYHHYTGGTQPGFVEWSLSLIGILTVVVVVGQMIWAAAPRWRELRAGGGRALAERLGGTRIGDRGEDAAQRRLVRVVEEMAVAAGLTPPAVYVLESQQALNAFAAGRDSDDAAIAVTRGLLDGLDRDELQAVVAHELSHIDNADTTLNMRLVVGITAIASIGQLGLNQIELAFEDMGSHHWHSHHTLSDNNPLGWRGGWFGLVYALLVGGVLMVIGGAGLGLAQLIKAAVSRRREFLADAGAVQFTRNPDGLAGALLVLHNDATPLSLGRANEVEHMLFASLDGALSRLLATHPPIEERMDALGIKYRQWYRENQREASASAAESSDGANPSAGQRAPASAETGGSSGMTPALGSLDQNLSVLALAVLTGDLNETTRRQAQERLADMPQAVREALSSGDGAEHMVYALLLHEPKQEDRDLPLLPEAAREPVHALRQRLLAHCGNQGRTAVDPHRRLPLLEMALPALANRPSEQHAQMRQTVDALIRANERLSVFEFTVRTLIGEQARDRQQDPIGMAALADRSHALRVMLSLLAHVGHSDEAERNQAYHLAATRLGIEQAPEPLPLKECSLQPFSKALRQLDDLQPSDKERLLETGLVCIGADQRIQPMEAELLTTIAVALNEPIPESVTA